MAISDLQQFKEGQVINHRLSKTIFESDNNLFCLLTMNSHPVHTNVEHAREARHGKILVVGTLVFSLVVGFTVEDVSMKAVASTEYTDIQHLRPVFIGDTLYAYSKILGIGEHILRVHTIGYNQQLKPVIEFKRNIYYA